MIVNPGAGAGGGTITGTLSLAGSSAAVTFPKQMSIEGTVLLAPGNRITASAGGSFAGNVTFDGTELSVSSVYSSSYLYNYVAFE